MKTWIKSGMFLALVMGFGLSMPAYGAKADGDKQKEIKELTKAIHKTEKETLAEFYKSEKDGQAIIKNAAGYGVFSAFNMNLLLLSTTRGRGIIHDRSGSATYMKAMKLGTGVGAGVQDYRVLMVFEDQADLNKVMKGGWFFQGDADAVATGAGQEGIEEGAEAQPLSNVKIYKFADNGVALQATVSSAKIWKDEDLDKRK
jgi:lipid-binding SYLF domain-containing protein